MYKNKCSDFDVFSSTGVKITEGLRERESYRNSNLIFSQNFFFVDWRRRAQRIIMIERRYQKEN